MRENRTDDGKKILKNVRDNGQEHILRFWDEIDEQEKKTLIDDIKKVDFDLVKRIRPLLIAGRVQTRTVEKPAVIFVPSTEKEREREREARECGMELIASSRTAVFTAAGGQSSRLGINAPKGTYPVTPASGKSLFEVHAQKIRYIQNKFRVHIPWIVMVSETNRLQTENFFKLHDFFGLERDLVRFIEQTMFPALDPEGRLFLREKHRLFMSPGGHGGTFSTLENSDTNDWLKNRGVEEIFYFQVDNVLVKVLDPVFLGYHVLGKSDMSSKCVSKRNPEEKIGMFVVEDGKTTVVEYSELDSIILKGDGDPYRELSSGSIAIHVINLDFTNRLKKKDMELPFHIAHKKIHHIGPDGKRVDPEEPNGYKLETFIFDALKYTDRSMIMEVLRQEEFSPLKNRSGADSPETVHRDQLLLFADWMESAGIQVPRRRDGLPAHRLEVSPLFAPFREDFISKASADIKITGDTVIEG